jgi:hypothetical protein
MLPAPVDAQQLQQFWRQQGSPVLAAFAAANPEDAAAAVDVFDLEVGYFRDSGAGGVMVDSMARYGRRLLGLRPPSADQCRISAPPKGRPQNAR